MKKKIFEQKNYFWKVKRKIQNKFPDLQEEDVEKMLNKIPYGLPLPVVDMMLTSTRAIYDVGDTKVLTAIRDKINQKKVNENVDD